MRFTGAAVSLNVPDVEASADWVRRHLGFAASMAADGFCSLEHPDAGFQLIYLRTGLASFRPASAAGRADGVLVVFEVADVDAEYDRLRRAGVDVLTPPQTEPWGERYCQASDPNGIVYQLVQWVAPPPARAVSDTARSAASGPPA